MADFAGVVILQPLMKVYGVSGVKPTGVGEGLQGVDIVKAAHGIAGRVRSR
jgi:hypothetical protein